MVQVPSPKLTVKFDYHCEEKWESDFVMWLAHEDSTPIKKLMLVSWQLSQKNLALKAGFHLLSHEASPLTCVAAHKG